MMNVLSGTLSVQPQDHKIFGCACACERRKDGMALGRWFRRQGFGLSNPTEHSAPWPYKFAKKAPFVASDAIQMPVKA